MLYLILMKNLLIQYRMSLIFVIDVVIAFVALLSMVVIRYGTNSLNTQIHLHLIPFTTVTVLFTLVFYIFNLYSSRFNRNITEFTNSFIKSLVISFVLSVFIFYIFGTFFKLTPKTNLILFTGIFGIIDFYARLHIKRYFINKGWDRKIVLIGNTESSLAKELKQNQNIGYKIIKEQNNLNPGEILQLAPDAVVVDTKSINKTEEMYDINKQGIQIYTLNNFYEEVFQKIPIDKIDMGEVLNYISNNKAIFNFIKRSFDIIFSTLLLVILSPALLITFLIIKATSKGPGLFPHTRISLNDTEFTIYKFRSMHLDAEKNGAVWTENTNTDPRITPFGRFIRKTHLDELPQLFNILKGDISFVGPRPERPEFVTSLRKDILYYDLRHSVKAGLTGWAQVNYKYGASVEDAREKLKYDFYYMKNRSIFFDFLIILKTIAEVFRY